MKDATTLLAARPPLDGEANGQRCPNTAPPQLSVVMPVYNEGAVIAKVVTSWLAG